MDMMDPRRMCPHCRAFITIKDKVCPYCKESLAPKQSGNESAGMFGGLIPHARFNMMIILLINAGIFVATVLFSMNWGHDSALMDVDTRTLVAFGAKYNPLIAQGEWWRLVTAGFLHGGIMHIVMNSIGLFILGADTEETYGASRMLVIYFCSTVAGFYASAVWSATVSVGASAAVFGLLGAMIADQVRRGQGLNFRGGYVMWALYNLVFGLIGGGNIDNAAHIGGLVAGFAIAYVAGTEGRLRSPKEYLWKAASWLCILLTALCFLKMYLWFTVNTR
jgi:rhomboid protease GluP